MPNLKSQESKQLYDTMLLALGILQLELGLSVVILSQHSDNDCLEIKCNIILKESLLLDCKRMFSFHDNLILMTVKQIDSYYLRMYIMVIKPIFSYQYLVTIL